MPWMDTVPALPPADGRAAQQVRQVVVHAQLAELEMQRAQGLALRLPQVLATGRTVEEVAGHLVRALDGADHAVRYLDELRQQTADVVALLQALVLVEARQRRGAPR